MKNLTAIVAIMAVFTLAVCFIILGSISTELMDRLGIDENQFGTLIAIFSFTFMGNLGLSYTTSVYLIGAGVLGFVVFAALAEYPRVSTGFSLARAVRLLRNPSVLLAAMALVCYIGLEWTMNNWTKPLMLGVFETHDSTNAARNAGFVLALFGLAMGIGRFATSAVREVSSLGTRIIAAASLVAIVALLVLARAESPIVAILAVLVVGLAYAPMFPTIVGVTFSRFEPAVYGSVFGIIFSIGLVGSMVLPKAIGYLSQDKPIQQSLPIAAAIAGILFAFVVGLETVRRPKGIGSHNPAGDR